METPSRRRMIAHRLYLTARAVLLVFAVCATVAAGVLYVHDAAARDALRACIAKYPRPLTRAELERYLAQKSAPKGMTSEQFFEEYTLQKYAGAKPIVRRYDLLTADAKPVDTPRELPPGFGPPEPERPDPDLEVTDPVRPFAPIAVKCNGWDLGDTITARAAWVGASIEIGTTQGTPYLTWQIVLLVALTWLPLALLMAAHRWFRWLTKPLGNS